MKFKAKSGADLVCATLQKAGVECVFGLPGTQNVALYQALRTSALRTITATSELSAAMMANGYFRASGRVGVLITIPGPGFTWAMAGLAEAALDSAALVHITGQPAVAPGRRFQLQALDQESIVRPLVKAVHNVDRVADLEVVLGAAIAQSFAEEPGPVVVQLARSVLQEKPVATAAPDSPPAERPQDMRNVGSAIRALAAARRCVILAGPGASGAPRLVTQLADFLAAAVVTPTARDGVLAEAHR